MNSPFGSTPDDVMLVANQRDAGLVATSATRNNGDDASAALSDFDDEQDDDDDDDDDLDFDEASVTAKHTKAGQHHGGDGWRVLTSRPLSKFEKDKMAAAKAKHKASIAAPKVRLLGPYEHQTVVIPCCSPVVLALLVMAVDHTVTGLLLEG